MWQQLQQAATGCLVAGPILTAASCAGLAGVACLPHSLTFLAVLSPSSVLLPPAALQEKARLAKMEGDREAVAQQIQARRAEEFAALKVRRGRGAVVQGPACLPGLARQQPGAAAFRELKQELMLLLTPVCRATCLPTGRAPACDGGAPRGPPPGVRRWPLGGRRGLGQSC